MKILLYGINYSPELTGIGKYSGEVARWLADQGHELRVVTAPPYYPDWRIGDGWRNSYSRHEWKGVDVWRVPLWVPAQPSGLKRIIHLTSFSVAALPVLTRQLRQLSPQTTTVPPATK